MSSVIAAGPPIGALRQPGCPKHMAYGPCGGVGRDGSCEVDARPCPFVGRELVSWAGDVAVGTTSALHASAHDLNNLAATRPVVIAEVPASSLDLDLHRRSASILAGCCDAGLSGDAPWGRVQLPPTMRAELLADEGLRAWVVLTCRDGNRAALEGELAGLVAVGAAGVHCVTGDHPVAGDRPDVEPVFDLDSTRLAALARHSGMLVSVTEAPTAPPTAQRVARLVSKARAGATWCLLNLVGDHRVLADFVAEVREAAPSLRLVVSIPVVTSVAALDQLRRYPGLSLAPETIRAVEEHGRATGPVATAVALAERSLAIEGVSGVNLIAPSAGGADVVSRDLAAIGRALGGGW
jgi:methylenetetrahydrofolate reductase (NADPH)